MSERPTPETDSVAEKINFGVDIDFARKLERERDEAREELKHITEYGTEEINAAVDLRQKLASALIERDEARAELALKQQTLTIAKGTLCDLRQELEDVRAQRDEARELVKAYQEYTNLLGDEINDMTAVAYVHGWRTNRYEEGKVIRDKIKRLEGAK